MAKRTIIFEKYIVSTVLLLLLCTILMGQDISVSPAIITFEGEPGEIVSKAITISNSGDKSHELITGFMDWDRDSLGNKIYSDAGTLPNSNLKLIKSIESLFTVGPGQSKTLYIQMEIPLDQTNPTATNSMLFITQTTPSDQPESESMLGIKVNFSFGIQLFYHPVNANMGDIKFQNVTHAERQLKISFKNDGDINKTGEINVELTNKADGTEYILPRKAFAIMPHDYQVYIADIPKEVKTGSYLAIIMLDAGQKTDLKIAEKDIYVQ